LDERTYEKFKDACNRYLNEIIKDAISKIDANLNRLAFVDEKQKRLKDIIRDLIKNIDDYFTLDDFILMHPYSLRIYPFFFRLGDFAYYHLLVEQPQTFGIAHSPLYYDVNEVEFEENFESVVDFNSEDLKFPKVEWHKAFEEMCSKFIEKQPFKEIASHVTIKYYLEKYASWFDYYDINEIETGEPREVALTNTRKIIILNELGILDNIKEKNNFEDWRPVAREVAKLLNIHIDSAVSGVIGIKHNTASNNNPLKSEKNKNWQKELKELLNR